MGKKIKDSERPEAFNKFRAEAFSKAKVNYDETNAIHSETYRRALRRFGLIDDSQVPSYPDSVSSYDLRTEEGISSLMAKVAEEYVEIKNGYESDPEYMRDVLWPLFIVKYNPKFETFANDQLTEIKMTLSQIDAIIETEGADEGVSKATAKGTSLEGIVGSPVSVAESIRNTINLRYIQSFGYKLKGFSEAISKDDLFDYVQRNLGKGAPFKISDEEQKSRDLAELKERAAKSKESPINSSASEGVDKAQASPVNEMDDVTATPSGTAPINAPESTSPAESKTTEAATSAAVTSAPAEVAKETAAPPSETILNVNLEKEVTPAPAAGSTQTTINNQATVEAPKEVSSSSEKVESSTNTILKTDSTKSTAINETKEKSGKFSSFLEKASESKIGKAINLGGIVSDIKDQAKDFGAVTKSELGLGKGGPLSKLGTGALNLVDRLKESKKEKSTVLSDNTTASTSSASINATTSEKTSTDTEKILSEKPGVSTSTSTSETIEKNKMIVKPEPVAPIVPPAQVTQNVETSNTSQTNQTSAPTTETSQTTNVENQGSSQTTNAGASPGISMPNFAEMERLLSNIQKILVLGIDELKTEKYD